MQKTVADELKISYACNLCQDTGFIFIEAYQEAGEIVDARSIKCSCGQ